MAKLLGNDWEKDQKISTFFTSIDQKDASYISLDLLYILVTSFHKAESTGPSNFVFVIQLDVKELKIYKQIMSYSHT